MRLIVSLLLRLFGLLAALLGVFLLAFNDTGSTVGMVVGVVCLAGGGWLAVRSGKKDPTAERHLWERRE